MRRLQSFDHLIGHERFLDSWWIFIWFSAALTQLTFPRPSRRSQSWQRSAVDDVIGLFYVGIITNGKNGDDQLLATWPIIAGREWFKKICHYQLKCHRVLDFHTTSCHETGGDDENRSQIPTELPWSTKYLFLLQGIAIEKTIALWLLPSCSSYSEWKRLNLEIESNKFYSERSQSKSKRN